MTFLIFCFVNVVIVFRKRGKMYNRCDFSDKYFKNSDFMFTNSHNESIRAVFPVRMYSYVKFIKLGNDRFDFSKVVCIHLIKEYF